MQILNKSGWRLEFQLACEKGDFLKVKELCQKTYLDSGMAELHGDSYFEEIGFCLACREGHLDVVKYLLTSSELREAGHTFANLHAMEELGLRWACLNGNLDIVKYLLTSKELLEAGHTWADVHAKDDTAWAWALFEGRENVLNWLIMDYQIPLTASIQKIINEASWDTKKEMQEKWRIREESVELNQALKGSLLRNDKKEERGSKKTKKL